MNKRYIDAPLVDETHLGYKITNAVVQRQRKPNGPLVEQRLSRLCVLVPSDTYRPALGGLVHRVAFTVPATARAAIDKQVQEQLQLVEFKRRSGLRDIAPGLEVAYWEALAAELRQRNMAAPDDRAMEATATAISHVDEQLAPDTLRERG